MTFRWLKRAMPRSLYGRAALILLLPIVTLQLVVSVGFIQRHFADVTRQMTRGVVTELALIATTWEEDEAVARVLAQALGIVPVDPTPPVPTADGLPFYDLSGRVVIAELRAGLPGVLAALTDGTRRVTVWLQTGTGLVALDFPRGRVSASNPHQLLVLMVVFGAFMTAIAYMFLRNQLRPIRRLALAAEEFGKGRVVTYRPGGAAEVRAAGTAFLEMRSRIERQAQARSLMLSGISHDLRTPLTRLRLGLSLIDDPEAEALRRDVDEMGRMVDAFLDFARDDAGDLPESIDLPALLDQAVTDAARAGQAVVLRPVAVPGPGPVALRPLAVRRAVGNLIENALRHGTRAEVALLWDERSLRILVEDDGPGIPVDRREEATRPFVRLDPARNQNHGPGVGLGLAIVMDVARAHGGSLRLGESATMGGLRAELVLAR